MIKCDLSALNKENPASLDWASLVQYAESAIEGSDTKRRPVEIASLATGFYTAHPDNSCRIKNVYTKQIGA